jgi:hypothetical protein
MRFIGALLYNKLIPIVDPIEKERSRVSFRKTGQQRVCQGLGSEVKPPRNHIRVIAVTFDRDLRHRTLLELGKGSVRVQVHPGGFAVSPTTVCSETEVLSNQKTILQNQVFILKNQEEIKKSQETLQVTVKNQEKILAAVHH